MENQADWSCVTKMLKTIEEGFKAKMLEDKINELGPFETWLLKNKDRINVNGQQIKDINFDNNMISIEVDGIFVKLEVKDGLCGKVDYVFPADGTFVEDVMYYGESKVWENMPQGT